MGLRIRLLSFCVHVVVVIQFELFTKYFQNTSPKGDNRQNLMVRVDWMHVQRGQFFSLFRRCDDEKYLSQASNGNGESDGLEQCENPRKNHQIYVIFFCLLCEFQFKSMWMGSFLLLGCSKTWSLSSSFDFWSFYYRNRCLFNTFETRRGKQLKNGFNPKPRQTKSFRVLLGSSSARRTLILLLF